MLRLSFTVISGVLSSQYSPPLSHTPLFLLQFRISTFNILEPSLRHGMLRWSSPWWAFAPTPGAVVAAVGAPPACWTMRVARAENPNFAMMKSTLSLWTHQLWNNNALHISMLHNRVLSYIRLGLGSGKLFYSVLNCWTFQETRLTVRPQNWSFLGSEILQGSWALASQRVLEWFGLIRWTIMKQFIR